MTLVIDVPLPTRSLEDASSVIVPVQASVSAPYMSAIFARTTDGHLVPAHMGGMTDYSVTEMAVIVLLENDFV